MSTMNTPQFPFLIAMFPPTRQTNPAHLDQNNIPIQSIHIQNLHEEDAELVIPLIVSSNRKIGVLIPSEFISDYELSPLPPIADENLTHCQGLPSSSSIPVASDDDGQDSGRHRGASKRKTGSSEEEGEDYGDEEDRLSRRVPKMKKVQVACNFCRGKLRCDGSRPSCHNCATRGMRCEYVDVLKRRGPGKAPKGSRPKKRPSSTPQDERIERKHSASPTAIPQEYSRPVFDIYRPPRSPPTMPGPVYSHPQAGRYGPAPTISDFPFSSFSSPSSSRPVPPLLPPLQTYLPTVVDDNRQYAPLPRRSRGTRRQSTPPLDGDDDKERSEF
ncbi:hypothetical protein DL96DRAFT_1712355 [Flagelloscypha sp. PMI_526]|nr:hypothetical protein DL96DRAFT_1712355 [Flagelloscypha sp. PMI_526]